MKDMMRHKGFAGSVHFISEEEIFHGKIEGIPDLVTFEGSTMEDLRQAFHEAVEDYLALCREVGKEPGESCKLPF